MGYAQRAILAVALVFAVATMATAVSASRAPAHQIAAQAAATVPCTPNVARMRGLLPELPVIDTWNLRPSPIGQPHFFRLNVIDDGEAPPLLYCYVQSATAVYVDAPTIRVKAGGIFTMQLVDQIAPTGTSPMPAPQATTPDGCALADYEEPIPAPNATGYGAHPRVISTANPPMMQNDTNFHTHGFHVEPDVDNVFKSLAMSRGGACTYEFKVRLNQPPGTYWYHAHMHGVAQQQVGGGLAGTLIVLPADAPSPTPAPIPDTVLLLKNNAAFVTPPPGQMAGMAMRNPGSGRGVHDRFFAHYKRFVPKGGALRAPRATAVADPFNPPPEPSGLAFDPTQPLPPYCAPIPTPANVSDPLLVNGYPTPASLTAPTIPKFFQVTNTDRRYRIVNASSDSYVNIGLYVGGSLRPFRVLARDGVEVTWGQVAPNPRAYVIRSNVMLGPSNRVDILVTGGTVPQTIVSIPGTLTMPQPAGYPFCTGPSGVPMPPRGILSILPRTAALNATPQKRGVATELHRTPGDIFASKAVPINQYRALTFSEYSDGTGYGFNFYVTETGSKPTPLPKPYVEAPFWLAANPRPAPPPISFHYLPEIRVKAHSVEEWTIVDATPEAHTFHIHQLTFVALQSGFEPTTERVFLDSIAVPSAKFVPGPRTPYQLLAPSVTRIKIDFRHVDRGTFVYHCHMLGHEDAGMMGIITVE